MPAQNDRWLRTSPNTQWQNLENQRFIDQAQLRSASLDGDRDTSDDEEEDFDSSEEMSDAEGRNNDSGGEISDEEDEADIKYNIECINFDPPGVADKKCPETHLSPDDQPPASRWQDRRTVNTKHGSVGQEDSVVERFLGAVQDQDLHRDSIARSSQFLKTVSLEDLEEGAGEFGESRILLEDRNFSRKTFRPYPRSMTPKQLYNALGKQRYPATTASNFATTTPELWTESEDCVVERRTLYMSNPNKLCALVLAATASPTQAPILFDFIDRYLKFETSISVNINYLASTRMTLSFHLPFYTCRERSCTDSREDHEGVPLRRSYEIPYMHLTGNSEDSQKPRRWICESQVSILVSIVDLNGWTAYAFEDTYYKKHEPTSYWDSFCSKLGYYYPDALSSGTLDSTRFLEPRMYFLRVFETRIDQVYREWRVVVDMLAEIVKRHRPDRIFTQSAGYRSRWNSKRDKQILLQQRYSEWISIITIIVSDQSGQISTTLTAWEEFEKRCSKYFPEDPYSPLDTSIGHTFSMIKLLKDRLDGLSQEIARDQITLALENTGTAKFVKALTVISIVMMPMVLDIALFSIQPGVMPFQMDFLAFVKSYFSLALFFCVIWIVLSQWDTLMLRGCFVLENLNSAFRPSSKTGNKPANGEEQASKMSGASADTDGDNSQMDGTSPQCHNPEMHAKAHHVADSSRSTPRTRGPDIQGPGVDAIRRQSESVSPQMTPQAAAAGLQYQAFDVQRAPWPQDQSSQIRIDAHNMSGEELSSQSLMGEIFAHVRTQWSSAESTEAQLDLLESLGKHKPKSVPEAAGIGSTWQGWLRCEWELPGVVQQLRESQSSEIQNLLRNVITITGGPGGMECSTCAEFLEKTWEESGLMALEVLSQGVALLEHGSTTSSRSTPSQTLEIRVTNTHIIIGVERDEQDAQSFVDAIVWICTAVRVNPQRQANSGERSQLQMSKASQLMSIKGVQPQVLVYGLADLTECSDQELGPQAKCWTGLFRSGIVAFHPCERSWGAGLEISFDMMIHLSGVENVYNIEGGVIFVGFSTALVPTSHDESTNSVQWHFEEVNGMSGELLRPCSLPSILGGWYKFQDVNILRTSKCFVGWYERANILLGTRQLVVDSHNRLDWSIDTKEHRQSVRMEGFEANGQLGFTAGPINTSLQLVSTWRFHSNVQHFCRHEQYSMALRLGCGNVAIIIDSESKQVWLVPMLSLILHLCHRYFQEINRNGQVDNPLPFADPSPDGASEAARVLERSGDVLVFGAEGDSDAENLRQLFLRINTNLLNAARTRESSNKRTLFASELMAMVTEPGRGSPLKKIRAAAAAESWVGLLARVDFVGVCANIGRLIEPDPPSTNPCICSALPSDRYLLAAHMRCLDALSQREGDKMRNSRNRVCRLGEKVFWNMGKLYWTRCPAAGHDPIWNEKDKILQQISSKEKGKGRDVQGVNGLTVPQQCLPEDGVVVFGGDPSKSLLQGLR